jgi:hypothetical protein
MLAEHPLPPLNPVAFAMALVAAPILVTLCTFWIAFIPVFALIFGGPVYLLAGTPVLLVMSLKVPLTPGRCAWAAFLTIVVLTVVVAAANIQMRATPYEGNALVAELGGYLMFGAFCAIFATIWAATFGVLYARFCRPAEEIET